MLTAVELVFCEKVGKLVKERFDLDDGGDLCYTLLQAQVVDMSEGEKYASTIVAQHMLQS